MVEPLNSLVPTQWLAENLANEDVVILDASKHLPAAGRDPRAEFTAGHIPGARFLDLDTLTNPDSSVPAAIPTAAQLSQRLSSLGVSRDTQVIFYDDSALKSSARAWFILSIYGINTSILDGGLAKWRIEERAIEVGTSQVEPSAPMELPGRPHGIYTKEELLNPLFRDNVQLVDARSADRVFGNGNDPVHGGQNGRIPGSFNVPYLSLFNEDGTYREPTEMYDLFMKAGVYPDARFVATCGSGVTACTLLFAVNEMGMGPHDLYDGSWSEWAADPDTPKVQGPA